MAPLISTTCYYCYCCDVVRLCLFVTVAANGTIHCPSPRWYISEYGATVELYWQGKKEGIGEKPAPVPPTLYTTNPTWTDLGANTGVRGDSTAWKLSQKTNVQCSYKIPVLLVRTTSVGSGNWFKSPCAHTHVTCAPSKGRVRACACVCTGTSESLPTLVVLTRSTGTLNHPVLSGKGDEGQNWLDLIKLTQARW
jgi:hypothetical protein